MGDESKQTRVVKRDGRNVKFDSFKVFRAIRNAMEHTEKGVDEDLCEKIVDAVKEKFSGTTVNVDEIQNFVENQMMKSSRKDAAKVYISKRRDRDVAREAKTRDIFMSIINAEHNDITRENANMNADTPAGEMMKFASESTKPFVDNYLLSEEAREAIKTNHIWVHDKDYYPTKSLTCIQHPLDRILKNGFKAGHAIVRPAKRIETASILACISMESIQNEMHGGQAIPALDFYMAPYVRMAYQEELKNLEDYDGKDYSELYDAPISDYLKKDLSDLSGLDRVKQQAINKTVSRVHQSMESFIHNLNTIHSRGGNQVVFSSVNYGTDTSAEGRCIIREILLSTEQGVGNNATAIFPIQIWKLKKGVSYLPGDPNYDLYQLACKVTAKRFFPNFLNLDASFNIDDEWDPNDPKRYIHEVATMGCRTRVYENSFGPKTSIGRGNLSFTTINLPKLGIECAIEDGYLVNNGTEEFPEYVFDESKNTEELRNKRVERFMEKLKNYVDVCARQLHDRYEFQKTALKKQFPLLMSGMWNGSDKLNDNDTIENVIRQGTLVVGFIGLAEALVALTGKHHGESEESQKIGLRAVDLINKEAKTFVKTYEHNYAGFATPAEGLAGKFTKIDKKTYGEIPGVTDRDYYTNSNHVPVYYSCSVEHKAEIEGPYHKLTPAGHIFYCEIDGDATKNPEAISDIVDIATKNDVGYLSVNHFQSRCPNCNFETADPDVHACPVCGSDLDTLQRITGYLVGTTDRWNDGKIAELKDRVQHGPYNKKKE